MESACIVSVRPGSQVTHGITGVHACAGTERSTTVTRGLTLPCMTKGDAPRLLLVTLSIKVARKSAAGRRHARTNLPRYLGMSMSPQRVVYCSAALVRQVSTRTERRDNVVLDRIHYIAVLSQRSSSCLPEVLALAVQTCGSGQ